MPVRKLLWALMVCVSACHAVAAGTPAADKESAAKTSATEPRYRWTNVTTKAPFAPRDGAGALVHRGRMWIVGGDANQGHYQSDVWNSANGKTWTYVNKSHELPWAPRVLHSTLAFKDRIWVIGGQTMPAFAAADEVFHRDVWKLERVEK